MNVHTTQAKLLEILTENIESTLTMRELCDMLDLSSPSLVHHHITQLEKKGFLKRNPNNPSDYQIITTPENPVVFINLYGSAKCGPDGTILSGNPIREELFNQFKKLHTEIFPNTYYSGQQILDMIDDTNQLFIETQNGNLVGFIHGKLDKSNNQGYIEFVGVCRSARRQGIGRKLVLAILHWLFKSFIQIEEAKLTVSSANIPAFNLYTSLGFVVEQSLQGYRKKLT